MPLEVQRVHYVNDDGLAKSELWNQTWFAGTEQCVASDRKRVHVLIAANIRPIAPGNILIGGPDGHFTLPVFETGQMPGIMYEFGIDDAREVMQGSIWHQHTAGRFNIIVLETLCVCESAVERLNAMG